MNLKQIGSTLRGIEMMHLIVGRGNSTAWIIGIYKNNKSDGSPLGLLAACFDDDDILYHDTNQQAEDELRERLTTGIVWMPQEGPLLRLVSMFRFLERVDVYRLAEAIETFQSVRDAAGGKCICRHNRRSRHRSFPGMPDTCPDCGEFLKSEV